LSLQILVVVQNKARLLGKEHRMSLEVDATKTGRDLVHGPTDAGKACEQVERPP
jgi:hypothetical protein